MGKCPAPWCEKELGPSESHPTHDRMMADPDWEYFGVKDESHPTLINVFRRPKKKPKSKSKELEP